MKKQRIITTFIPAACIIILISCTPRIRFTIESPGGSGEMRSLYIEDIVDKRPQNEKTGYDVLYLKSISDAAYPKGFTAEFTKAVHNRFSRAFAVVNNKKDAQWMLTVTVHHYYGEYDRPVAATIWEIGSVLLLFIPRLVTDLIPYNNFAGRVAMDLSFVNRKGTTAVKSFDVLVQDTVITYRRGNAYTASRLGNSASKEINRIIGEMEDH